MRSAFLGAIPLAVLCWACGSAPQPVERVSLPAPSCNCPVVPVMSASPPRSSADLDALAQHRIDLARKRIPVVRRLYERGMTTASELIVAYRDIAVAARDSGLRGEARITPITEYRDAMSQMRELVRSRVTAGAENEDALNHAEIQLAEAEYWLAEAKAQR